jgi:hypothetical protein
MNLKLTPSVFWQFLVHKRLTICLIIKRLCAYTPLSILPILGLSRALFSSNTPSLLLSVQYLPCAYEVTQVLPCLYLLKPVFL